MTDTRTTPLDIVRDHLAKHVKTVDPGDIDVITLWAAHTWFLEPGQADHAARSLWYTPRLVVAARGPGSGKSTLLSHLHGLVHAPRYVSAATTAAVTALGENGEQPTLLYDEANYTIGKGETGDALAATLNSGYEPTGVRLMRQQIDGKNVTVEQPTYFPVAIAGNDVPLRADTLDRSIVVMLEKAAPGTIAHMHGRDLARTLPALRTALAAWCQQDDVRQEVLAAADVEPMSASEGWSLRTRDRWESLWQVAMAAGGAWPDRLTERILADAKNDAAKDDEGVIENASWVFARHAHEVWPTGEDWWPTADIVDTLTGRWPDMWNASAKNGPLTATDVRTHLVTLAKGVPGLTIETQQQQRSGKRQRGYRRSVFDAIWSRYDIGAEAERERLEPIDLTALASASAGGYTPAYRRSA